MAIAAETRPGAVRLRVTDPDRARDYYQQAIGLRQLGQAEDGLVTLGANGHRLVELLPDPEATPRPAGTTGLFHHAILFPDRPALAHSLKRAIGANAPITGASDHLVSESLYLSDPESNGIELYVDRPRSEWPHADGKLQMATIPLDVRGLLVEVGDKEPPIQAPDETKMGHVHLNVADLGETRRFYVDLLGFEATVEDYPGALFVSAGGYHHHVGLNTWAGEGAPPPPPGSAGLVWFELVLPSEEELRSVEGRLKDGGHEPEPEAGGLRLSDPSGNGILLTTKG